MINKRGNDMGRKVINRIGEERVNNIHKNAAELYHKYNSRYFGSKRRCM